MAGTNYGGVVGGGRLAAGDGKVAGRACPAPTGWMEGLVGAGRERAGGGVKTPPYDVKDKRVVMGKRAGRACPAPTGGGRGNGCLPEGAREG